VTDAFQSDGIAITTRQVMEDGWPILLVTHDADDGAWQFVNGRGDTDTTDSAMVVAIEVVLRVDPSLVELADLPLGWHAWRQSAGDEWIRGTR
jgi:hypothetical protein